jgi:hypothetical protein
MTSTNRATPPTPRGLPSPSNSWTTAFNAVYAQQEFHSLFQGDMSIGEYCGRLNRLADMLYDCGAAVSDLALVINTLRGLNNKFSQAIAMLSTMMPPPTFLYTKSYLLQEEHRIKRSLEIEAHMALLAAQDTGSSTTVNKATPAPRPPSPAPASTTPSGGGGDRRKKRKADNRNRQSAPSSQPSHTTPLHHSGRRRTIPWQGVVQAWSLNSWCPSILAPCPGVAPSSAMTALTAPPPQQYPGTIPPELYTALNGMSLNTPSGGGSDWFLDTGATSHMVSHLGILSSCTGNSIIPTTSSLCLNNILIAPQLVKNLISIRALTRDNSVSVEFDPWGFTIKDLRTRMAIL